MDDFKKMHCLPVAPDTPRLNNKEIADLLSQIKGWNLLEKDSEPRIEKSFRFKDFNQAVAFTNQIAHEADAEDHHPAILTEWGKVTVTWWTHRIKGLHLNDFIMAARTDQHFDETG